MPKFDCVVFSHVLEHVYDIPAFFTAARRLLTPGGYLYLETPDATPLRRISLRAVPGIQYRAHQSLFAVTLKTPPAVSVFSPFW